MVFGVHFLPSVFPFGWYGVQIFFVLSGFLITGILFDTRYKQHRFRNFYGRRALRIFPLYYGFLLLVASVVIATHGKAPKALWMWFVYVQNFWWLTVPSQTDILFTGGGHPLAAIGHFWSLAVEEQFYILWPLLVFSVRGRRKLMWVSVVLIAFRQVLTTYWQMHMPSQALDTGIIYRMLPTQWDSFLIGGLLALWLRGRPSQKIQSNSGLFAAASTTAYGLLLLVLHSRPAIISGQNVFDYRSSFQTLIGLPLSNVVSVLLLLAVLQPQTWAHKLCHLRPMRSLGRISYGLYVYHLSLFVIAGQLVSKLYSILHLRHSHISLAIAISSTALTVIVSYASFYLYEKPFLKLKSRYFSEPKPDSLPQQFVEAQHYNGWISR